MPDFAKVVAYIVIDAMTLLLWHQTMMSRVSRGSYLSHLKALIDFYIRQCQPLPIELSDKRLFQQRIVSVCSGANSDTLA